MMEIVSDIRIVEEHHCRVLYLVIHRHMERENNVHLKQILFMDSKRAFSHFILLHCLMSMLELIHLIEMLSFLISGTARICRQAIPLD